MNTGLLKKVGIAHIVYAVISIFYLIGGGALFALFKGIKTNSFNPLTIVWLIVSLVWIAGEFTLGIQGVKYNEKETKYKTMSLVAMILLVSSIVEIVLGLFIIKFNVTHTIFNILFSVGLSLLMIFCINQISGKKVLLAAKKK